ncbi:hypothetical protein AX15_001958 [Amanita polypyramis BW_CC]|nr:hypothetical protein AX15_001958 [Amanita polypyramis BW_CC]
MHSSALFLLLSLVAFAVAADLYKVLDVSRSASETDIRHAYRKLSRKYHPDKNKDPDAESKFVEIAHAYEVLSNPEKRQIYDRHGEDGLKARENGQHANPFDIFQNFFGGPPTEQSRKGPSSLTEFEVRLSDVYEGASIDFNVQKKVLCDHCRGSGAASSSDIHTCSSCGGSGVRIVKQQIFPGMYAQSQVTCPDCQGRGRVIKKVCPHCRGEKVLDHIQSYTLEVPPGTPENHEIVFEGEADESPDWDAGDIVIRVKSKKDKGGWRRKESSLYWKETIGVDEALLGFDRNLTHLDGHIVQLHRTGITQPGFVQTIKGEGMPIFRQSSHGELFVEYNVVLPMELSPHLRQKLMDAFWSSESGHDEL